MALWLKPAHMLTNITVWVGVHPGEHMLSACWWEEGFSLIDESSQRRQWENGFIDHTSSTCFLRLISGTLHAGAGSSKMRRKIHTNLCTFLYFKSIVSQSAKMAGFPSSSSSSSSSLIRFLLFWIEGELWLSCWHPSHTQMQRCVS